MADPLQSSSRMVVPLILLGTFTKLAFAVAITHRTWLWWLPGALAIAGGALATLHPAWSDVGEGCVVLGSCALVAARLVRPTPRSML